MQSTMKTHSSETHHKHDSHSKSKEKRGGEEEEKNMQRRINRKYFFAALIFGSAALMLAMWYLRKKAEANKEASSNRREMQGKSEGGNDTLMIQGAKADAKKAPVESKPPVKFPDGETEQSMLELAKEIFKADIRVYGTSRCGWTQRQREIFGGRDSQARMVFESSYVECVTFDMCPGVEGFPSWKVGDKVFPGFRPPQAIRTLLEQAKRMKEEQAAMQQMKAAMESAAIRETARQAKRTEKTAIEIETIQEEVDEGEDAEDEEEDEEDGLESKRKRNVRAAEARRKAKATTRTRSKKTLVVQEPEEDQAEEDEPRVQIISEESGERNGESNGESTNGDEQPKRQRKRRTSKKNETQKESKETEVQKEMVRGVSDYPPLNVPNMPGTAPMALAATGLEYFEDQIRQGNRPRMSTENPNPVPAIAEQLAASLRHIEEQKAINEKDGTPHATQISSRSNPLGDKSA